MRYDNADKRLRGRRGVARRLRLWSASPFCAMCGCLTEYDGFHLDHRQALALGGLDVDENLQVLCHSCHAQKTAYEEAGNIHGTYNPEWLMPVPSLTIVFGAPGSGKSTYVQENAEHTDTVIDMDLIRAELAGMPIYQAGPEYLRRSASVRNHMLSSLSRSGAPGWLIATGQGKAQRDWWTNKLRPINVIVMKTPLDECIRRIQADDRRPDELKKQHIAAARAWWMAENSPHEVRSTKVAFDANGRAIW